MAKLNMIIPINTYNYNELLVNRIGELYSSSAKLHIGIMGSKGMEVRNALDISAITSIQEIITPCFNYAYCVNYTMRSLLEDNKLKKDDVVCISDFWSITSLMQCDSYIKQTDFSKNYIPLHIYEWIYDEEINLDSKKLMLTILQKTKSMLNKNDKNVKKNIPVPVVTVQQFLESNGLEENFFTNISRLNFMDYLDRASYVSIKTHFPGLQIHKEPYRAKDVAKDLEFYNILNTMSKGVTPIKSNIGRDFGDPDRLKYLKVVNGDALWSNQIGRVVNVISHSRSAVKTVRTAKAPTVELLREKSIVPLTEQQNESLLICKSSISDVMIATNKIKELYKEYGPVTVLTEKRMDPNVQLMSNFMVKKVVDFFMMNNEKITFDTYKEIYQLGTFKCSVNIPEGSKQIDDVQTHNPYCHNGVWFDRPTQQISPIGFVISTKPNRYHEIDSDRLGILERIYDYLLPFQIPMIVVSLDGERKIFQKDIKNRSRFITSYYDKSIGDAAAILHYCKLNIVLAHSDCSWLCYGLKKPTILLDNVDRDYPYDTVPWFKYEEFSDPRICEKVLNHIIESI